MAANFCVRTVNESWHFVPARPWKRVPTDPRRPTGPVSTADIVATFLKACVLLKRLLSRSHARTNRRDARDKEETDGTQA